MRRPYILCLLCLVVSSARAAALAESKEAVAVQATVETSLTTASPQIRMFAFDGDANSYFASANNPGKDDHFTLVFDAPVAVKVVSVLTGRVNGNDTLDAGTLEISEDGKTFEKAGTFEKGEIKADLKGRKLTALRLKPADDLKHPLAVREFAVDSDPPVAIFKHPVEVFTDSKDAPEMKEWLDKAGRVCERQYQMICEELASDGFLPKKVVTMTLKNDYQGVAYTASTRIVGAVKYFKDHQKDVGAMVHEMVHVGQQYHSRSNPGWLVEGLADYIRNYKYEEKKPRQLPPERAKFDGSYQITARFLAFLVDKYDPLIVKKLNAIMRDGKYNADTFKDLTKKTAEELGAEWKESLTKK